MKSALFLLLCLGFSASALAARPARVDSDELPIFQELKPDSPIIRTLIKGTRVTVSNLPTQGFYRVRTNEGEVGWVSEQGLQVFDRPTEAEVKKLEKQKLEMKEQAEDKEREQEDEDVEKQEVKKKRSMMTLDVESENDEHIRKTRTSAYHHWMVNVLYGASLVDLGSLRSLTGLDLPRQGTQFGIELQYMPRKSWIPLIFRIESISVGGVIKDSSNNVYNISAGSTPIMGGVRIDLVDQNDLSIDVSALIGMSFNQSFRLETLSQSSPNVVELTGTAFAALLKANLNYRFAGDWFAFLEMGYRSLKASNPDYSGDSKSANGNGVMQRNGSLLTVPIDLSGFVSSIGVSYRF